MKITHTLSKLSKTYDIPYTNMGKHDGLARFRKEFAKQLPEYKPGSSYLKLLAQFTIEK